MNALACFKLLLEVCVVGGLFVFQFCTEHTRAIFRWLSQITIYPTCPGFCRPLSIAIVCIPKFLCSDLSWSLWCHFPFLWLFFHSRLPYYLSCRVIKLSRCSVFSWTSFCSFLHSSARSLGDASDVFPPHFPLSLGPWFPVKDLAHRGGISVVCSLFSLWHEIKQPLMLTQAHTFQFLKNAWKCFC